jgi:hypothetical protein
LSGDAPDRTAFAAAIGSRALSETPRVRNKRTA